MWLWLSHIVSEIFNVEEWCTLEIGVSDHSRLLITYDFISVCPVNIALSRTVFEMFDVEEYRDLQVYVWVTRPVSARAVHPTRSYLFAVVSMGLSSFTSTQRASEKPHDVRLLSLKVTVGHRIATNRKVR